MANHRLFRQSIVWQSWFRQN